jgi:hypothetical protein
MSSKKSSKSDVTQHGLYKTQNRYEANKRRKLLKLLKKHPNNTQISDALKSIKWGRKTPNTKVWSKQKIRFEMLKKEFKAAKIVEGSSKYMFALGTRAHSNGEYLWAMK